MPRCARAALLTILRRVCDPSARRLELAEELLASGSGAVQLSPHARLRAGSGRIWLEYPADAERPAADLCMPLEPGEWALGGDFCVKIEMLDAKFVPLGPDVYKKDLNSLADYAKIASSARLRTRQPGDRFAPRGRGVTKTLHAILLKRKSPPPAGPCGLWQRTGAACSGCGAPALRGDPARTGYPADHTDHADPTSGGCIMSLNDDILKVLYSEEELKAKCAEMGAQITKDYAGKNLLLVTVLKGAVVYFTDLMRAIDLPCTIDFMIVSSYGSGVKTSGVVKIVKDLDTDLTARTC